MKWAQIKSGQRLHIVCEPGEELRGRIVRAGTLSAPLCNTPHFTGNYRMTINVPLANACRNCLRVKRAMK